MNIIIKHIGFILIDTTTKASEGKQYTVDKMEVHYIAYPHSSHEVRGMITMPFNEHIYLPEISRQIRIELQYAK